MLQGDIKMKTKTNVSKTVFVSKFLAYDKKTVMVTLWSDHNKANHDRWQNECSKHLNCCVDEEPRSKYSAAALKSVDTGKILIIKPVKQVKYYCSHK